MTPWLVTWFNAVFSAAVVLATSSLANAATYSNVRYGYWVSYPDDALVAEPEADAGDGRAFHARHGTAKMSVWATWNLHDNAVDQSPRGVAREAAMDCANQALPYRVVKRTFVALSCVTPKGSVIYQKTLISKDVLTSVRFEYPSAEKAHWDDVVKSVAATLQQGGPAQ